ncbi:cytochrome P450 [Cadophora sp. DSE1049]|nr:cytochrome P450 [Cadophora sp. DSE1049]
MAFQISLLHIVGAGTIAAFLISKIKGYSLLDILPLVYLATIPLYITVYQSYIYPFYISELRHVPTVPGYPLWGQFIEIITKECGVPQRQWHQEHGPIIRYFFPFGAERLALWMVRILGEGVLLAEGSAHVHQRKALAPGFSIGSIRALSPVFWQKALLLSRLWKEEMEQSRVTTKCFEVLEWLNRTTLDIIGQAGFGTDINSLENPDTPIREAYRLVFAFDIGSRILHGLQAFIPTGEEGLSFETMRDQVMTFLGAGHDTTATGVAWTLHLLSKYPSIQSRLRDEIKHFMPFLFDPAMRYDAESLAKADADQLPYLDNVCRESLRYIPPIPMTVRESIADDQLGDYHVPGGTVIYVLANAINRLPMYWGPTADEFNPDRWDKLPETYTTNAFMTFLQGPRGCVGRKFAETEMKIILCCLLSLYEFDMDRSVVDPESLKMWRLVLRPRDGVSLKVKTL